MLTFTFPFRQFYGKITHAQALGMSKSHHRQRSILLGNKDQLFLAGSSAVEGSTVHVAAEGAIGLLTGAGQEGASSDGDEPQDDQM
jgi:hypothetical protein